MTNTTTTTTTTSAKSKSADKKAALNEQTGTTEAVKEPEVAKTSGRGRSKAPMSLTEMTDILANSSELPNGKIQKKTISIQIPEAIACAIVNMAGTIAADRADDPVKSANKVTVSDLASIALMNMINDLKKGPLFKSDKKDIDACVKYVNQQFNITGKHMAVNDYLPEAEPEKDSK